MFLILCLALLVKHGVPLKDTLPAIRDLIGKSKKHLTKVNSGSPGYLIVDGECSLDLSVDLVSEIFCLLPQLVELFACIGKHVSENAGLVITDVSQLSDYILISNAPFCGVSTPPELFFQGVKV